MRLGVSLPAEGLPLAELPPLARRAEALGYTDAWSFEVNGYDAFSPLAAAAAVTDEMRLGTAIVPVYTRPAGLIAMQASCSLARTTPSDSCARNFAGIVNRFFASSVCSYCPRNDKQRSPSKLRLRLSESPCRAWDGGVGGAPPSRSGPNCRPL